MISFGILYGMTINMISLFGMILVVGILVDDGIVIAENIYAHFERGKSPMRAALDGTSEVMNAVFTSVLTTVFAFSTLLFVGGEMEMMEEMAFSVIACLLFSLIEAFLILPSHLASKKILKPNDSKFRKALNNGVKYVRDGYGRVLEKMLRRHRLHVWRPMGFIFVIAVLFNFGWIRWTFFPSIPFDSILVEFTYQPGERENKTENFLWYCDSIVEQYNQELINRYNDTIITYKSVSVGSTENLGEYGSHVGSIRISVKENDHISTIDMSNELRVKFPEDSVRLLEKFTVGGQQRFGKEVSISLQSEERKGVITVLYHLYDYLTTWFAPVLCHTMEETWKELQTEKIKSVHLKVSKKMSDLWHQEELINKWKLIRKVRRLVNTAIENVRNKKLIGSSLEAVIDLEVPTNYFKILSNLNLSEIFICSKVEFKVSDDLENDEIRVNCKKVSGLKCERCWKISDDVKIASSLCPRCTNVIDTLR